MSIISTEVDVVKLGETILPGIYQSMEISGALRFDESQIQGQSGKSKQPLGYEDATIILNMILPSNDLGSCYDRLKVIVALFYNTDKAVKPYIYKITNSLTNIWGIRDVLFKDLRVRDDNIKKDSLSVDITFTEYRPVIVKREKKTIPVANLDPYTDFTQFNTQPIQTKTVDSPAKDDDKP